jgi:hypothetical protein
MRKHSFSAAPAAKSGVAGRQNVYSKYSGTGSARVINQQPASNLTTEGGAYDNSETHVNGPEGQPTGNQYSRLMSAKPGEFQQSVTPGNPLKESGRATDVIGTSDSGQSYVSQKPKSDGRKL